MKPAVGFIICMLLLTMYQASGWAMYRCVDSKGKVRYTDSPVSDSCTAMDLGEEVTVRVSDKTAFRARLRQSIKSSLTGKYDHYINYYGVRFNVDPNLIRAVIKTESGFNPKAVSKKGAQGLMQLMPATAKELKVTDPFDPKQNIEGGTRYLRTLLTTFKEDKQLALAAYNAGPTTVKRQKGIPQIPETVRYVQRVLKYYRQYKSGRV